MTHFGIICPATTGHLNPMTTLGWELQQRGHQVTLFGLLDARAATHSAGLGFGAIGESDYPLGAMAQIFDRQGRLSGLKAVRYTITWIGDIIATFLKEAPAVIKAAGVEVLLVDQISPEGGTIADFLKIPFISVASALMSYRDLSIPPSNTPWSYSPAGWAILRNWFGYTLLDRIVQPAVNIITEYRRQWQLPKYTHPNDFYSSLALITQQPIAFEFPRQNLPKHIHFTGPFSNSLSRSAVDFPYAQLTGKPLIYASLGTLQNRLQHVFEDIAQACVGLDAQLVISLGNEIAAASLPKLAGNPIVVNYAPQFELLQRASLVITHAGVNTTLGSLSNAVPMVAIPISLDQPSVAARIAWTGTGEVIALDRLSESRLHTAVQRVLTENIYKNNALRLQASILSAGGVSRAADIAERVAQTGQPVLVRSGVSSA
jgi:zeaxanthin glucosyltransferase